jgi:hypothetical protein
MHTNRVCTAWATLKQFSKAKQGGFEKSVEIITKSASYKNCVVDNKYFYYQYEISPQADIQSSY